MKVQGVDTDYVSLQGGRAKTVWQGKQDVQLSGNKDSDFKVARDYERVKGDMDAELRQQKLEEAVEQTNKTMETYGTELRFSIHEESGEIMVKVIDTRDNSVIREIPPERILDMVAYVKKMLGFIIDKFI